MERERLRRKAALITFEVDLVAGRHWANGSDPKLIDVRRRKSEGAVESFRKVGGGVRSGSDFFLD